MNRKILPGDIVTVPDRGKLVLGVVLVRYLRSRDGNGRAPFVIYLCICVVDRYLYLPAYEAELHWAESETRSLSFDIGDTVRVDRRDDLPYGLTLYGSGCDAKMNYEVRVICATLQPVRKNALFDNYAVDTPDRNLLGFACRLSVEVVRFGEGAQVVFPSILYVPNSAKVSKPYRDPEQLSRLQLIHEPDVSACFRTGFVLSRGDFADSVRGLRERKADVKRDNPWRHRVC